MTLDPTNIPTTDSTNIPAATQPQPASGAVTHPVAEAGHSGTTATGVAASSATHAGTPSPSFSVREYLTSKGLSDASRFGSDAEVVDYLLREREAAHQVQELARLGQYVAPHIADIQKLLEQKQQPKPATGRPEYLPEWWNPPQWDPGLERYLKRDPETGGVVAMPGAPADAIQRYHAHQAFQEQVARRLTQDPFGLLEQPTRHWAREEFSKEKDNLLQVINKRLAEIENRAFAQQVLDSNPWLFRFDPQTHQRSINRQGEVFTNVVRMLQENGVTDVNIQASIGLAMARELQKQQATPTPGAPPTRDASNNAFIQAANRPGGSPAAVAPAGGPVGDNYDGPDLFAHMMRQEMARLNGQAA